MCTFFSRNWKIKKYLIELIDNNLTYSLFYLGRICSIHFEPSCFKKSLRLPLLGYFPKRVRKDNAIPTLHLFNESHMKKVRKLEDDAVPTLHLYNESHVKNTQLLDHIDKEGATVVANIPMNCIDTLQKVSNASMHIEVSPKKIESTASTHINVTSRKIVAASMSNMDVLNMNNTILVTPSTSVATNLHSSNKDVGTM